MSLKNLGLDDLKKELVVVKEALVASIVRTEELRVYLRQVRIAIKEERTINRVVREDHKQLRAAKKEERRLAQVAKLEARLAKLLAKETKKKSPKALKKAARKPSPVTLIAAEPVAA